MAKSNLGILLIDPRGALIGFHSPSDAITAVARLLNLDVRPFMHPRTLASVMPLLLIIVKPYKRETQSTRNFLGVREFLITIMSVSF